MEGKVLTPTWALLHIYNPTYIHTGMHAHMHTCAHTHSTVFDYRSRIEASNLLFITNLCVMLLVCEPYFM